jgi:hypothetical protein
MLETRRIAQDVCASLELTEWMGTLHVEGADTPWNEKVRLRKKKGGFDVRLFVWENQAYLYGRVYRLLLYVKDALDHDFLYNIDDVPHGTLEPKSRENYHHIWSIFVDSRLEQRGIDNFFDRTLRRNMFVDAQKHVPWTVSLLFFEKLWARECLTHPEIVDLAHNLDKIMSPPGDQTGFEAFELEISKSLTDRSLRNHIERMPSNSLRETAERIIGFVTGRCKGTLIEPSYYGIYFMYDQEIFVEMVTTKADALLVTLFDFQSSEHRTYSVTETSQDELRAIEEAVEAVYKKIVYHSQLKAMKNPFTSPVER